MRDPGNEVGEVEENVEVEGKQNSLFPAGPVMKCFVYLPTQKRKKKQQKKCLPDVGWHINLVGLKGAQPDHVRVESLSCCFPRELVSFARPWELVSFVRPRRVSEF